MNLLLRNHFIIFLLLQPIPALAATAAFVSAQEWQLCGGLTTARLEVHLAQEQDLPAIKDIMFEESVRKSLTVDAQKFTQELEPAFRRSLEFNNGAAISPRSTDFVLDAQNTEIFFVAKKGTEIVGVLGLRKDPEESARHLRLSVREPEVRDSYFLWVAIAPRFQNQNYGFEAVSGLVAVAFGILHSPHLFWLALPENHGSKALARKLGFKPCEGAAVTEAGEECLMKTTDHPAVLRRIQRK